MFDFLLFCFLCMPKLFFIVFLLFSTPNTLKCKVETFLFYTSMFLLYTWVWYVKCNFFELVKLLLRRFWMIITFTLILVKNRLKWTIWISKNYKTLFRDCQMIYNSFFYLLYTLDITNHCRISYHLNLINCGIGMIKRRI